MDKEQISRLLPEIFQATRQAQPDVLGAFLGVMQNLQTGDEAVLENLDRYFDPRQTLDAWLPFLSSWVDLDRFLDEKGQFPFGPARLRLLILAALRLSQERGTRRGLCAFLEAATGLQGFQVQDDPRRPYHILVNSPAPSKAYLEGFSMSLDQYKACLNHLIHAEKPAYVTCELHLLEDSEKKS